MIKPLFLPVSGSSERATKIFSGYQKQAFEQDSTYEKLAALGKVKRLAIDYFIDKEEAFHQVRDSKDLKTREFALNEASQAFNIAKLTSTLYRLLADLYFTESPEKAELLFKPKRGERAEFLLKAASFENTTFDLENLTSQDLISPILKMRYNN